MIWCRICSLFSTSGTLANEIGRITLHKTWSFSWRISLVNKTKSTGNGDFVTFAEEIFNGKLHFLCSVSDSVQINPLEIMKRWPNFTLWRNWFHVYNTETTELLLLADVGSLCLRLTKIFRLCCIEIELENLDVINSFLICFLSLQLYFNKFTCIIWKTNIWNIFFV